MTWYILPIFYVTQPSTARGMPVITQVNLTPSGSDGRSFYLNVTGFNRGETTDIQLISVSFPNLTGDIRPRQNNLSSGHVQVHRHNFTQSPLFVMPGDIVESGYSGGTETTVAKYPSVEFFSRPWKSGAGYQAVLEVSAESAGRFIIFIKTTSFPHLNENSHYPHEGLKDYQEEFVEVYSTYMK